MAKPTASDDILKSNIEFACGQTNCGPIEEGGLCFKPNTLAHHASYAMNNYYQLSGKVAGSCGFQNSAMIVTSNPGNTSTFYLPFQMEILNITIEICFCFVQAMVPVAIMLLHHHKYNRLLEKP